MAMLQVKHHKLRLEAYPKNVYIWRMQDMRTTKWFKKRYTYKVTENFYITTFNGEELLKYIKS